MAVVMGSVDDVDSTLALVRKLGLTIPAAYGLDGRRLSQVLGCHYDADKGFAHATGFLLDADKRVNVACYSTGAVGRLRADNTLSLAKYYQTKDTTHLPQA